MKNNIIIPIIALFFLSGCATLVNKNGNKLSFASNVPGVSIYNSDRKLLGTTPVVLAFKPNKPVNLVFEKEGYQTQTAKFEAKEMKGFAFVDAMLLCIPCIVDYSTGAIFKYEKDSVFVRLKKKLDEKLEKIDIAIEDINWDVKEGYKIGKDKKEDIIFKKNIFDSRHYKETICNIFTQNGPYKNDECGGENSFKYVKNHTDIVIKPAIKNMTMNVKAKGDHEYNFCDFDLEWGFYYGQNKTPFKTITTPVKGIGEDLDKRATVNKLLSDNSYNIAEDTALYALLYSYQGNKKKDVSVDALAILTSIKPKFKKTSEMISTTSSSVVTIEHDEGHGSGFIISKDGYLLTNYHVVKGKDKVNVQLNQSITLGADVVRFDDKYDVALLKLQGKGFSPLYLGDSDSLTLGDEAYCIGTPADISLGQSVSKGIVSGKRKIEDRVYIQTDVSMNAGNSGGPLINDQGEVMGMVTMKLIGKGIEGIGFCIPSNIIKEVLELTDAKKK